MNQNINEIEVLVNQCFREIADHTLQSDILSPQIKTINSKQSNI